MNFIFDASLETVPHAPPPGTWRENNPCEFYFFRPNALALTQPTNQPAKCHPWRKIQHTFFSLRSHRNTHFTSHRYDLGLAEEPLSRAFFSVLYLFFSIPNHTLLSIFCFALFVDVLETINTLYDLLFSSVRHFLIKKEQYDLIIIIIIIKLHTNLRHKQSPYLLF